MQQVAILPGRMGSRSVEATNFRGSARQGVTTMKSVSFVCSAQTAPSWNNRRMGLLSCGSSQY